MKGQAVDFEIPGVPNMETALWIKEHLDYDQLLLEFYKEKIPDSGWVHCSYDRERKQKPSKAVRRTEMVPVVLSVDAINQRSSSTDITSAPTVSA